MSANTPKFYSILKITTITAVAIGAHWLGYQRGSQSVAAANSILTESESKVEPDARPVEAPSEKEPSIAVTTREPAADLKKLGRDSAILNINDAFAELSSLPNNQKALFLAGIIEEIAAASSPKEAIALINHPDLDNLQGAAARMLVSEWIAHSSQLTPEEATQWRQRIRSIQGNRLGLEVELGMVLAKANVDASIAQAWMDAHSDHPGRSRLFSGLIFQPSTNPPTTGQTGNETNSRRIYLKTGLKAIQKRLYNGIQKTATPLAMLSPTKSSIRSPATILFSPASCYPKFKIPIKGENQSRPSHLGWLASAPRTPSIG